MQALNGEGPIDWAKTRQVLLAPGEMIAADIGRYVVLPPRVARLLASIDLERAEVQQMARQTTMATEALAEVQQEWAALQGAAARLLTKAEALQHLTEEMERSVERDLSLGESGMRDGRAEGKESAPAKGTETSGVPTLTARALPATLRDLGSGHLAGCGPPRLGPLEEFSTRITLGQRVSAGHYRQRFGRGSSDVAFPTGTLLP